METNAITLLPLDGERKVVIHQGAHRYIYTFGRLTPEIWCKAFEAAVVSTEPGGRGSTRQMNGSLQSGVDLVRSTVKEVSGYDIPEDLPNWRDRLPSGHVRAVAADLQVVYVDPAAESKPASLSAVEISLCASWNVGDERVLFGGLVHKFTPPSADCERRYLRAMSETIVQAGGRTVFPSRHTTLLTLYDELIQDVEGYSVGGQPLHGRDAILREMDRLHKAVAAGALFAQSASAEAGE